MSFEIEISSDAFKIKRRALGNAREGRYSAKSCKANVLWSWNSLTWMLFDSDSLSLETRYFS